MSADPQEVVARLVSRAGLPPGAVVLSGSGPEQSPPPEGPWVVVDAGAQWVVGGVGRGRFAPYEGLWTTTDALDLAVRLAGSPLPARSAPLARDEVEQGRRTAAGILDRTRARGDEPAAAGLEPGDLLDLVGPETGHHLYALGTPFPERSQPPSDVGAPYHALRVARRLPDEVLEGRAAPWFAQPGGGAMVVLHRPVRWFVDQGYLALAELPVGT